MTIVAGVGRLNVIGRLASDPRIVVASHTRRGGLTVIHLHLSKIPGNVTVPTNICRRQMVPSFANGLLTVVATRTLTCNVGMIKTGILPSRCYMAALVLH